MACPSSDDMCMASRESIQPVGNVRSDIIQALQESASRADMVLVSGGLGPTFRPRNQVVVPHEAPAAPAKTARPLPRTCWERGQGDDAVSGSSPLGAPYSAYLPTFASTAARTEPSAMNWWA